LVRSGERKKKSEKVLTRQRKSYTLCLVKRETDRNRNQKGETMEAVEMTANIRTDQLNRAYNMAWDALVLYQAAIRGYKWALDEDQLALEEKLKEVHDLMVAVVKKK